MKTFPAVENSNQSQFTSASCRPRRPRRPHHHQLLPLVPPPQPLNTAFPETIEKDRSLPIAISRPRTTFSTHDSLLRRPLGDQLLLRAQPPGPCCRPSPCSAASSFDSWVRRTWFDQRMRRSALLFRNNRLFRLFSSYNLPATAFVIQSNRGRCAL